MALRFADGFDHYTTTADLLTLWTNYINSPQAPSANGRFGTNGILLSGTSRGLYVTLDDQATWIVGMAFKPTVSVSAQLVPMIALVDIATNQCYVRLNTAGKLEVIGGAGTILGTGTTTLSVGVYYYLEFKATISDAAGVAVVKLNGVTEINLSSVDTKNSANATASTITIFGQGGVSTDFALDDIYVCDGTGGTNNDFLGDVRVESLFPSGNGNTSNLTGSDGNSTDNYLLVDETSPNGDTDYVESSNVGDKDTYAYTNLVSTTGTVYGVQILPYGKKTNAGARSIASVARLAGTETDGPNETLSPSYQYLEDIRETKPGGGAWTIADVNSAEFGTKVTV